jgi:hypothetical protein
VKLKGVWILVLTLAAAAWIGFGAKLPNIDWPTPGPVAPTKPPLVVVLFESEHGEPPAYAAGAVNDLRKAGREARLMDDDPATGMDSVPAEVAPAIEPGRTIMGGTDGKGFALVLLDGSKVRKAMALPTSKEAILEAAQ